MWEVYGSGRKGKFCRIYIWLVGIIMNNRDNNWLYMGGKGYVGRLNDKCVGVRRYGESCKYKFY